MGSSETESETKMEMVNIPTAEQVRKITTKHNNKEVLKILSTIKVAIEAMARKGGRAANVGVPYRLHVCVKQHLESLGYEIDCGNSQRDGTWFRVSW